MSVPDWSEIEAIFAAALERTAAERSSYLDQACRGRPELRTEVDSLLESHGKAGGFLASIPVPEEFAREPSAIGQRVGAYRLTKELGRGGMGAVYLGERDDEHFTQQVAVKLIRSGDASEVSRARFREERQILAQLEHPNIARLLDGGITAAGEQYIIMERVEGVPIDQYCDRNSLGLAQRLRLFQTICAAVHFAHQHFIVHRDIKPGNILVASGPDGQPVPKLLDFGIAKVISQSGDATKTIAPALTPDFASPEQIRGDAITTASDVYSLAVLLYGLLSGKTPYQLTGKTLAEAMRAICEEDPPRPSVAAGRAELAGDLDAIVMKGMRKEPRERYASAEAFAQDVERYLALRPVEARRGTYRYVTRKFIARHKFAVTASALTVALAIAGLTAVGIEYRIAQQQRARAERRFNDVRKLAGSVITEIHDGIAELPGSIEVRKLLVSRSLEYLDSLAREAEGDASLQVELAGAYVRLGDLQGGSYAAHLGDYAGAAKTYEKARAAMSAVVARQPRFVAAQVQLAKTSAGLANVLNAELREHARALAISREALGAWQTAATLAPNDRDIREGIANGHLLIAKVLNTSQLGDALPNFEAAIKLHTELLAESPENANAQRNLALDHKYVCSVFELRKDYARAADYCSRAVELDAKRAAASPASAPAQLDLAFSLSQSGTIYRYRHDLAAAENSFRRSVEIREALAAADPKDMRVQDSLFYPRWVLASVLVDQRREAEAMPHFRHAIEMGEARIHRNEADSFTRSTLAEAHLDAAELARKLGQERESCSHFAAAVHHLGELERKGPLNAAGLALKARTAKARGCVPH
jgi:non-specific serine/threonine protein kinase/serine/threonine-protein kinase